MSKWFYKLEGKEVEGPISTTQLKELAKNGTLKQTDLIWKEGYEKWVKAKRLQGLYDKKNISLPPIPEDRKSVSSFNSEQKNNPINHQRKERKYIKKEEKKHLKIQPDSEIPNKNKEISSDRLQKLPDNCPEFPASHVNLENQKIFSFRKLAVLCSLPIFCFTCCLIPDWNNSTVPIANPINRMKEINRVKEIASRFEGKYVENETNGKTQLNIYINNQRKANAQDAQNNREEIRAANANFLATIQDKSLLSYAKIDPDGFANIINKAERRKTDAFYLIKNGYISIEQDDFNELVKLINTILNQKIYEINLEVRLGRRLSLKDIEESPNIVILDSKRSASFFNNLKSFTISIPKSIVAENHIDKIEVQDFLKKIPNAKIKFEK